MSNDSAEPSVSEPDERPPRNPIERVFVWGGIGLLLVVVGIEARAQRGYAMSLDAVQCAFADKEEVLVELADARKLMMLSPAETQKSSGSSAVDHYYFSWFSLFKRGQYEIGLKVSTEDLEVISFSTPQAPSPAWLMEMSQPDGAVNFETELAHGESSGSGFFGGDWARNQSFQRPPSPLIVKLDADGDNELSAEEIEASPAALNELDKNDDGELTPEEFDPEGFGHDGGRGGFASGGGSEFERGNSRPRRPEIEE